MGLFDNLLSRTIDDAGCAVWQQSCCNGHPAVRHGEKTKLVRRLLWEDLHGPIPPGGVVKMTCETVKCVTPDHMKLTTVKEIAQECGKLGLMSGRIRSAKIAKAKQAQSRVTPEIAREIKTSPEKGRALAAKHGLSENLVSKIRTGKSWRDLSSPFAGLVL